MRRTLSFWHQSGLGVALALACTVPAQAQDSAVGPASVLTQHNDNARTGANLRETTLTTANVKPDTFGKLFTRTVDGYLYAQPLYVPNLPVPGQGIHNVVLLATAHDSVYCFDADDPKAAEPLWQVSLGTPVPAAEVYDPNDPRGWTDMLVDIGITSTPVIALASHTIYVETKTKEGSTYVQRLHALDIATGKERTGSPVVIQAKVKGSGDGGDGSTVTFNPVKQLQRPGLLLSNGVVYLAFGSHADNPPFHGWILGYDAQTLRQVSVFNTAPDGSDAAIWQAGMGMASDGAGNVYAMTGNGTFTANTGGKDYGDTMLKLRPTVHGLVVADYFTPHDQDALSAADQDLGGSGPMLIPNSNLIVGGGKNAFLYVVRRDRMGKFNPDSDHQISQSFHLDGAANIHGSPVYWNSPHGPLIYVMAENDHLKAFRMIQNTFRTTPDSQSDVAAPDGMPGGFLSVSADGGTPGTGIVWACHPFDDNANHRTVPGVLRAYDAQDLTHELWDSKQNADRDDLGMFAKFCAPTVANGKVYAPTFSNELQVYGLLDGVLPAIESVSATSAHLVVHYKKPVEAATASKPTNYALDNGARVLRASLDGDGKTVYLATTPLQPGTQYTLTAQGVRDRANPKMALPAATHAWVRPGTATAQR